LRNNFFIFTLKVSKERFNHAFGISWQNWQKFSGINGWVGEWAEVKPVL
jgi:hypothetical protein